MNVTLGLRLSSLRWIGFSVIAGVAFPIVLVGTWLFAFVASWPLRSLFPNSLYGVLILVVLMAIPVAALGIIPYLALRPHWSWWPASLVGPIIGLIGGFFLLERVFGLTLYCFAMSAGSAQLCERAEMRTQIWNALELVAPLAAMGLLQALTVRGLARKIGWFVTSQVAAFGLVYGLIGIGIALGASSHQLKVWLYAFLAGALWGIIVGVALTFLSPASSRPQPAAAAT
jgi:hypothetical protein